MSATLEESDRRELDRIPVNPGDVFSLRTSLGLELLFTAENISCQGLLVRFVWVGSGNRPGPGESVVIEQCPMDLDSHLTGMTGEIRWMQDTLCGIRFLEELELSQDELLEFLDRRGLMGWEGGI